MNCSKRIEIKAVCLSAWRRRDLSALGISQAENETESLAKLNFPLALLKTFFVAIPFTERKKIYTLNFTNISNFCIKQFKKMVYYLDCESLIPCNAKLIIYKSSKGILPHLTYCHLVWHNHTKSFWFVQYLIEDCKILLYYCTK